MRALIRASIAMVVLVLMGAGIVWLATRPRPTHASPLRPNAAAPADTVRYDAAGRLMFYNLRAVEEEHFYIGSDFPRRHQVNGQEVYADESAFNLLRSLGVTLVVALQPVAEQYYAEQGYFQYWSEATGYTIDTLWVPVAGDPWGRDDRSALHATAEVLALMRGRDPAAGAVYVHDDHGGAGPAVVAAGYTLWRNRGWLSADTAWQQAVDAYAAGNRTMEQARGAGAAVERDRCPSGRNDFFCRERLAPLRDDLERIIEL